MTATLLKGGRRAPLTRLAALADEVALALVDEPPTFPEDYIAVLELLDHIRATVAVAKREAQNQLIDRTTRGKHAFGPYLVVRGLHYDRSEWDHLGVADNLVKAGADVPELIACAGISYWRGNRMAGTGTFAFGVDRDDYCTRREVQDVKIERIGR